MAARVTDAEVRAILPGLPAADSVASQIDSANVFVDARLAGKTDTTTDLPVTEPTLKQVELYLAAHLVAIGRPALNLASNSGQGSSSSIGGQFGMGLQGTRFGQQAIMLDPTGTLAAMVRASSGSSSSGGGGSAAVQAGVKVV